MSGPGNTEVLTSGVYRRIYAGYLRGERINSISVEAEAWFWRINAIADDYGNLEADRNVLWAMTVGKRAVTVGKRAVTVDHVHGWVKECLRVGLIWKYADKSNEYYHVDGFEWRQPMGRNGKRYQKFPMHPATRPSESRIIQNNPEKSKIIPNNPDCTITTTNTTTSTKTITTTNSCSPPSAGTVAAPPKPKSDFEKWWAAWPKGQRKTDKRGCLNFWNCNFLDHIAAKVHKSLSWHKGKNPDWLKDGGQYIPGPIRWLRKRPWETDPEELVAPEPEAKPDASGMWGPHVPRRLPEDGELMMLDQVYKSELPPESAA